MRRVAGSEDQPGKSFRLAGFEFPVSSWWNSISDQILASWEKHTLRLNLKSIVNRV